MTASYIDVMNGQPYNQQYGSPQGRVRQIYSPTDLPSLQTQYPQATPAMLQALTGPQNTNFVHTTSTQPAILQGATRGGINAANLSTPQGAGYALNNAAGDGIKNMLGLQALHTIGYDDNKNPFVEGGGAMMNNTKALNGQDIYFKPETSFFSDFMHNGLPIAAGVVGGALGIPGLGTGVQLATGGGNNASQSSSIPTAARNLGTSLANYSPKTPSFTTNQLATGLRAA